MAAATRTIAGDHGSSRRTRNASNRPYPRAIKDETRTTHRMVHSVGPNWGRTILASLIVICSFMKGQSCMAGWYPVGGGGGLAGETGDCNFCWDRARKVPRFPDTRVPSVEEMRTPSAGDPSYQILDGMSCLPFTMTSTRARSK